MSAATDVGGLFAELRSLAGADAAQIRGADSLEAFRVKWLGRRDGICSRITENWLKSAPPEYKKAIGAGLNELRAALDASVESAKSSVGDTGSGPAIDLSLPGVERTMGTRHLIRQTFEEIERIFMSIGFSVVEGPEIETPYYNFEALNIPEYHPARDNMDTFYIGTAREQPLLRRTLRRCRFAPWKCSNRRCASLCRAKFIAAIIRTRRTASCSTNSKGWRWIPTSLFAISTARWNILCGHFSAPKVKTRLRPSHFPFTEPSVEVDATCHVCGGSARLPRVQTIRMD